MVSESNGPSQFQLSQRRVEPGVTGADKSTPLIEGCEVKTGALADCFLSTFRTIVPLLVEIMTVHENTWPASDVRTRTVGDVLPTKRLGAVQEIEVETEFFHWPGSQVSEPFVAKFPDICGSTVAIGALRFTTVDLSSTALSPF
jgi:hypothetical protein